MSGPSGHWYADEDDVLHELPWGAQLLYLRGLRRFMHASGVVGITRRISYRGLMETLTVPESRGRHTRAQEVPTVSMVRHLLAVLVKSGLLEPLPGRIGCLVFRLPYALQDQSVSRMSDTMSDTMSDRVTGRVKPHSSAGLRGVDTSMSDTMSDRMSDTQQSKAVIGNNSSTYRSPSRANTSAHEASAVGALCGRLRREAHMLDANPHRDELRALLADGFDIEVIVSTAVELAARPKGVPNVGYLVSTVRGRFHDSQQSGVSYAGNGNRRESVCERIERQNREYDDREEGGPHLSIVH